MEFVLIERFGWTPAQLREQRFQDIRTMLIIMDVEGHVHQARRKGK